jgi:adenine-specific DNA methylase
MPRPRPTILELPQRWCHRQTGAIYGDMVIKADDEEETEARELGEQAQAAADAIRATVLRLLKEGEVDPRLIVLAVPRVAGELGDLAEVLRQAGHDQREMLQAEMLPVAGRA